jgi:hypothetical protein
MIALMTMTMVMVVVVVVVMMTVAVPHVHAQLLFRAPAFLHITMNHAVASASMVVTGSRHGVLKRI